jgi:hypothetical protein
MVKNAHQAASEAKLPHEVIPIVPLGVQGPIFCLQSGWYCVGIGI